MDDHNWHKMTNTQFKIGCIKKLISDDFKRLLYRIHLRAHIIVVGFLFLGCSTFMLRHISEIQTIFLLNNFGKSAYIGTGSSFSHNTDGSC